jgi:precorrin-2 dehydrogenase/sirohydrochlorin ferrochelatase
MARYYPVSLDIRGKTCLVVGGGEVAVRKVRALHQAGAHVSVVAPEVQPKLRALEGVEIRERAFRDTDLHGVFLVVVATDDPVLNRAVGRDAADLGCLVNVVDCPALSNFIVPATLRRGELSISISTGGASPTLARRIREGLEGQFGEEYADFVDVLAEVRREIFDKVPESERRAGLCRELTDEKWVRLLRERGRDALRTEMLKFLAGR